MHPNNMKLPPFGIDYSCFRIDGITVLVDYCAKPRVIFKVVDTVPCIGFLIINILSKEYILMWKTQKAYGCHWIQLAVQKHCSLWKQIFLNINKL